MKSDTGLLLAAVESQLEVFNTFGYFGDLVVHLEEDEFCMNRLFRQLRPSDFDRIVINCPCGGRDEALHGDSVMISNIGSAFTLPGLDSMFGNTDLMERENNG